MDSTELDQKYGHYYVPEFRIMLGPKDLVRELHLAVTSVEVTMTRRRPTQFSFTVANAFDWEHRDFVIGPEGEVNLMDLFEPGKSVSVAMGYAEKELATMVKGKVNSVSTQLSPSSVPELTVSGLDELDSLTRGGRPRHWEGVRDSQAVRDVLGEHHVALTPDVEDLGPVRPRIDRNSQSSIDFIRELAERNGATFYVRDGTFYFRRRDNERTAALELAWGSGLLSFSPEASLGHQVQEVVVRARSADGELIEGRASAGVESGRDRGRRTGSEYAGGASAGRSNQLVVRSSVHTQDEANDAARRLLDERSHQFAKATGESLGLPELRPNVNLSVLGVGRTFSKVWLVSEATHTVDGQGYRTRFRVEEPNL